MLHDHTDLRAQAFLAALLEGSARRAEDAVRTALADGMEPAEVHVQVVAPAMRAVGELWARDEITVADEHLATAITYRALNVVSSAGGAAGAPWRPRVMLAALAGEHHVVGLQMVSDTLEAAGFEIMLLGADVPLDALLAAVARYAPAVLGLSATMPGASSLRDAIARVQAVDPELPVLVGGPGVPDEARHVPAPRYVADAAQVVAEVESLLRLAG
jgi:methanogenic corrinoid protein MtbC1